MITLQGEQRAWSGRFDVDVIFDRDSKGLASTEESSMSFVKLASHIIPNLAERLAEKGYNYRGVKDASEFKIGELGLMTGGSMLINKHDPQNYGYNVKADYRIFIEERVESMFAGEVYFDTVTVKSSWADTGIKDEDFDLSTSQSEIEDLIRQSAESTFALQGEYIALESCEVKEDKE